LIVNARVENFEVDLFHLSVREPLHKSRAVATAALRDARAEGEAQAAPVY
jgi:hypothetical protein